MEGSYSSNLYQHLVAAFPRSGIKEDKQSWLKFDNTGTLIYVNGSKRHDTRSGWYDLDVSIYDSLMSAQNSYQAIVLGEPNTTFLLSKHVVKNIVSSQPKLYENGKRKRWMFTVIADSSKYYLVLGGNTKHDITKYLNNWNLVPEFTTC